MTIEWDAEARQLHLRNESISYLARVLDSGTLGHLYLGPALAAGRSYVHLERGSFPGFANRVGDPIPLEVPTAGSGDQRVPCLSVVHADGSSVLDLQVVGHRVLSGKPDLPGLPSTYLEAEQEAETVEVDLLDRPSGLEECCH
jgi:alpha-galactosidase